MRLPARLRPLWPYAKTAYTAMTRAVAPASMRIDAMRGGWLPRSVATSTAEALREPGNGVRHEIAPGEVVDREAPAGVPADLQTLRRQTHAVFGPLAVLELPHGRVAGPSRALITQDGTLLYDEIRYFGTARPTEHPVFLHPRVGAPTEIDGRIVVLASRGDANYYHFLHDVVPRLGVLDRWGHGDVPQRYYVPNTSSFQREFLSMLGITGEQIVDADATPHIRADVLLVPTLPDLDLNHPRWAVDVLRDKLLARRWGLVPGRRVYVTRGRARNTRTVRNEDEVLAALSGYGFQIVDPGRLSVAEQIRTFAEAEVLVAPHGAALANLAFASPGAQVIELFAPDYVQGCYWKLSTCIPDLGYQYLVGTGRVGRLRESRGVASDIDIDLRSLVPMVDRLVARESRR